MLSDRKNELIFLFWQDGRARRHLHEAPWQQSLTIELDLSRRPLISLGWTNENGSFRHWIFLFSWSTTGMWWVRFLGFQLLSRFYLSNLANFQVYNRCSRTGLTDGCTMSKHGELEGAGDISAIDTAKMELRLFSLLSPSHLDLLELFHFISQRSVVIQA